MIYNFNSVCLFLLSIIGHNQVIVSMLAIPEVGIMTAPENISIVEGEDVVLTCKFRNLGKCGNSIFFNTLYLVFND